MAINLEKKQTINLTKDVPTLNNVLVGLGWDESDGSVQEIDCDVSVFMLASDYKIPSEPYFVFYNNLTSADGSVIHQGDNTTGEGDGDDECIEINLSKVNPEIEQMMFVVTIHDAESRNQDFSNLDNSFIRICDNNSGEELCRFTLNDDFIGSDSVQIGRLYRSENEWGFEAMGDPFHGGLSALIELYVK